MTPPTCSRRYWHLTVTKLKRTQMVKRLKLEDPDSALYSMDWPILRENILNVMENANGQSGLSAFSTSRELVKGIKQKLVYKLPFLE